MKKNPFKEIATHKEPPVQIKKKVLGEIASIGLMTDVADLFSVKLASVIGSIFEPSKQEASKKREKE